MAIKKKNKLVDEAQRPDAFDDSQAIEDGDMFEAEPLPSDTLMSKVQTWQDKPAEAPAAAPAQPAPMAPKPVAPAPSDSATADAIAESSTPQLDADISRNIGVMNQEKNPPKVQRDLDWLENRYNQLNSEYKDEKDSLEWRHVAETVANAMTQLFAAREGLKQGVDMSGTKFDKQDWDAKLKLAQGERATGEGQATKLFDAADADRKEEDVRQRDEAKLELGNRNASLAEKKAEAAERNAQRRHEESMRRLDRQAAKDAKQAEVDSEYLVPGHGQAFSKQDGKELREKVASTNSGLQIIDKIADVGKDISVINLEDRAELGIYMNMLVGRLREPVGGPGAMTANDRKVIENTIGDPSKLLSTERIETRKLNALRNVLNSDLRTQLEAKLYKDTEGNPYKSPAAAPKSSDKPAETPEQKLMRLRKLKAAKDGAKS